MPSRGSHFLLATNPEKIGLREKIAPKVKTIQNLKSREVGIATEIVTNPEVAIATETANNLEAAIATEAVTKTVTVTNLEVAIATEAVTKIEVGIGIEAANNLEAVNRGAVKSRLDGEIKQVSQTQLEAASFPPNW